MSFASQIFQPESKELLLKRLQLKQTLNDKIQPSPKQDGSIKKNSTFIKKLKNGVTSTTLSSILTDLNSLKVDKYIEEIASSLIEKPSKTNADTLATVELLMILHKRYDEFMPIFMGFLKTQFNPLLVVQENEKMELPRVSKLKSISRLMIELYFLGFLKDKGDKYVIHLLLHQMFHKDNQQNNLSVAVSFCKYYMPFFYPRAEISETDLSLDIIKECLDIRDQLVPEACCIRVFQLLLTYYKSASDNLLKDHLKTQQLEKSNQENLIAKGSSTQERPEKLVLLFQKFEKFKQNMQSLSMNLGASMPDLPIEKSQIFTIGIAGNVVGEEVGLGIWEDEESKKFYEDIVDLSNLVPVVLLGKKVSSDAEIVVEEVSVEGSLEGEPEVAVDGDGDGKEEDEEGDEKSGASNSVKLNDLITRLMAALNKDIVDQLAVEFAFINNKGTKKRLASALLGVSRQRLDLLPYFGRFLATLNPFMPDLSLTVVQELQSSFRFHQRKKDQLFIEEKIKNIRFLGELTKFKLVPYPIVLNCLKVLLDDFNFHNVELVSNLLETCGRFLTNNSQTSTAMGNFIDILKRKKAVGSLDTKHVFMIENAIYACLPPDEPVVGGKQREPIELFIRKLIYKDLERSNVESTLKLLRKLNWNDALVNKTLQKVFFKVWKVRFSNIYLLAFMVAELCRYYPDFGIAVTDNCLEEIRKGLELNLFRRNQRRLACIKFLGELYNYRMIDSTVIFDTLYLLVRFGHEKGVPVPNLPSLLDMTDDFFRPRLICVLLDTCCANFRGSSDRKLDVFLIFFQMYLFTKTKLPLEAEFFVKETFDKIRPGYIFLNSYEESVVQWNIVAKYMMEEDGSEDDAEVPANEPEVPDIVDEPVVAEDNDEEEESGEDEETDDEIENNEESGQQEPVDENISEDEDGELFDLEYSRMIQDSLTSRKLNRKPAIFDAPVPTIKSNLEKPDITNSVTFTLLTKKGNKQQIKQMAIPADSEFALETLRMQKVELEERNKLKKLVLDYDNRERVTTGIPAKPENRNRFRSNEYE